MTRDERNRLIDKYANSIAEVSSSLDGFPTHQLRERPFAGKWTAAEIVHHLADSETTSALRLRKLLVESFPVIYGYDQEAFATKLRYNERPIGPSLDAFRAARESTVQLLRLMSDDDWKREGWHSESGRYTAETWVTIYAEHAHDHAAQIRKLREALSK